MPSKVFFRQLSLLTLITAAALVLFNRYPLFADHQTLYWVLLGFYFLSAGALFFLGKKLAASENKNAFTQFVMGATFFKMLLSMSVLVGYLKFAAAGSRYFIVPFLTVYLAFTVFETYFLMKIAKIKPDGKA